MNHSYSVNGLLRNLAQNLEFKVFIFDDPQFGPEIKLRERSKKGEIDAVLLFKNVICLVGIDGGKRQRVKRELLKYFEKLDRVEKVDSLRLYIKVTKKTGKKTAEEKAKETLKGVNDNIKTICSEYEPILRKVFFCPFKRLEENEIRELQEDGKFIIDRDIHDYFQEVLIRLDKNFLRNDFLHFLKIRKVNLQKKSESKIQKPEKSQPYRVDRLSIKDQIIMYSLSIRAEDIVEYITVLRAARTYDKKGFQRMVKPGRLKKINEEYLVDNQTFPNNVIIALDPELYVDERDFYDRGKHELTFLKEYNSLIIIDGQHRFFALVKGKKLDRHILVTLISFSGEDKGKNKDLIVRMFYEINKKQERIDPNLSFYLKARISPDSPENFWYSVFKKLDKKGFFAKRFSFKETTMRKKGEPKTIVSVVTYGGVLRLNREYKKKGIAVSGLDIFYDPNDRERNIEFAFCLLKNYFDIIEAVLHNQSVPKDSLTPREIGALIRLLKHFMLDSKDSLRALGSVQNITKNSKYKTVVKYFEGILNYIPFADTIKLEYPASNWAALEGHMLKKINLSKSNFGNKYLLSKKGLEVYDQIA